MIIMKFGGASLSKSDGINKVCHIIKEYSAKEKIVVVVSAMKGVTDDLYRVTDFLKQKKFKSALEKVGDIKKEHFNSLSVIKSKSIAVKVESELINIVSRLENFVRNTAKKDITPARIDYIVSFGERLSCPIVAGALESHGMMAHPIDASFVLATNHSFGNAIPLYKKSQDHINQILFPLVNNGIIPVITGFIGFAPDGCTTTLGRGGSDLTAAYLANLIKAKALYLWKDVDGFYTDDPLKDRQARLITKLSYYQAEKMAKGGAKIIFYKAIRPVARKDIPIYIKSFINPKAAGTVVN